MITTPGHSLILGGTLDLLGKDHTLGWWIEAAGEGTEFGNPEPVEQTILSFLMDGSIATTQSYDNREMPLQVTLYGTNSANLAAAEAALMAQVGIPNTLEWTPPDTTGDFAGATSVFDVVTSHLDFLFSDINELHLQRTYTLTLKALPFPHSNALAQIVSAAPAVTAPSTASVDDGTSITGWVGARKGGSLTPTTSGGAVRGQWTNNTGAAVNDAFVTLSKSGLSVDMSTKPYLRIDYTVWNWRSTTGIHTNTVKLNGTTVTEVARNGSVAWYAMPGGATTLTSWAITTATPLQSIATASISLAVWDVTKSDMPQDTTGARQVFRTLNVLGSVRSPGSLALESATSALGSVLVYTVPADATLQQPPLRAFRTDGGSATTDTTLVSNKWSDLTVQHQFDVPAVNVPSGNYLLMARIKVTSGTAYSLTWSGTSVMGGTQLDTTFPNGVRTGTAATNVWTVVPVGRMTLPTFAMAQNGLVRIKLQAAATCQLDEVWIFNTDLGRLTQIECGTGTAAAGGPSSRVWLDAAALENPMPSVWLGFASDRFDSHGAGPALASYAAHQYAPPQTNVFVVTTNAVDTALTLSYWPHAHTHVA